MRYIIFTFFLFITSLSLFGQEEADSNFAVYESEDFTYLFHSPEGWALNLDQAQNDGYSAALFPDSEQYIGASQTVYIWIYTTDSIKFDEFVSLDSANYVKENAIKIDTSYLLDIDKELSAYILEVADPGGASQLNMIAYLSSHPDIIIYELNILGREFRAQAEDKFVEAIKLFDRMRRPNPPEE